MDFDFTAALASLASRRETLTNNKAIDDKINNLNKKKDEYKEQAKKLYNKINDKSTIGEIDEVMGKIQQIQVLISDTIKEIETLKKEKEFKTFDKNDEKEMEGLMNPKKININVIIEDEDKDHISNDCNTFKTEKNNEQTPILNEFLSKFEEAFKEMIQEENNKEKKEDETTKLSTDAPVFVPKCKKEENKKDAKDECFITFIGPYAFIDNRSSDASMKIPCNDIRGDIPIPKFIVSSFH